MSSTVETTPNTRSDFDASIGGVEKDTRLLGNASYQRMLRVEQELNATLIARDQVLRGVIVTAIAGHHGVLLGPPGEAKSYTVDAFRKRIVDAVPFKLLMTRFTTPEDVFGPVSITQLKQDRYVRNTDGYLPSAHIAFLDEPFKAGPSILNTLLMMMNERLYINDAKPVEVPLEALFGASNEMPQGDELGALWDRFLTRFWIDPLKGANLRRFMVEKRLAAARQARARAAGAHLGVPTPDAPPPPTTIKLTDLHELRAAAVTAQGNMPDRAYELYEDILRQLQAKGFKLPSTRRTGWAFELVAANAAMAGRSHPNETDMTVLAQVLWDHPKEAREVNNIVLKICNPRLSIAQEHLDTVLNVVASTITYWGEEHTKAEKNAKVTEARSKMSEEGTRLRRLVLEAKGAGEDYTQIENIIAQVRASYEEVTALVGIDTVKW